MSSHWHRDPSSMQTKRTRKTIVLRHLFSTTFVFVMRICFCLEINKKAYINITIANRDRDLIHISSVSISKYLTNICTRSLTYTWILVDSDCYVISFPTINILKLKTTYTLNHLCLSRDSCYCFFER